MHYTTSCFSFKYLVKLSNFFDKIVQIYSCSTHSVGNFWFTWYERFYNVSFIFGHTKRKSALRRWSALYIKHLKDGYLSPNHQRGKRTDKLCWSMVNLLRLVIGFWCYLIWFLWLYLWGIFSWFLFLSKKHHRYLIRKSIKCSPFTNNKHWNQAATDISRIHNLFTLVLIRSYIRDMII